MSPWRKLWLKALAEGEVELRLDSLLEATRARNSLYHAIRPARNGKGSSDLLEAAETLELIWDGKLTLRIRQKQAPTELQGKVDNLLKQQSFESISPEKQAELSRMAEAALAAVGKKIPYYKREGE